MMILSDTRSKLGANSLYPLTLTHMGDAYVGDKLKVYLPEFVMIEVNRKCKRPEPLRKLKTSWLHC